MTSEFWYPHVTVAAIVYKSEKFLMVKEFRDGKIVLNQPAGHLENNETLINAVERETFEETGWRVKTRAFLGVRHNKVPNGTNYLRLTYIADAISHDPKAELDEGIIESIWMSKEEIDEYQHMLRGPIVMHDIEAFLRSEQLELDAVFEHSSVLQELD